LSVPPAVSGPVVVNLISSVLPGASPGLSCLYPNRPAVNEPVHPEGACTPVIVTPAGAKYRMHDVIPSVLMLSMLSPADPEPVTFADALTAA
jgi:hypothetical protein